MESVYGLEAIDARGVLPGRAVVPDPPYQILELPLAAENTGVQDLGHVVPLLAVDYDWGGWVGPIDILFHRPPSPSPHICLGRTLLLGLVPVIFVIEKPVRISNVSDRRIYLGRGCKP